jgi:hypothetical protein
MAPLSKRALAQIAGMNPSTFNGDHTVGTSATTPSTAATDTTPIAPRRLIMLSCGANRLVLVFRQGRLSKVGEQQIQSVKCDCLRSRNLDSERATRNTVIDNEQPVRRSHGARALLTSRMRKVQVHSEWPASAICDL